MYNLEVVELKNVNAHLSLIFNKLLANLDSFQKKKLEASQSAWLKYRDENAEFEASFYEGGTAQPLNRIGYQISMTKKRAKELQEVIDANPYLKK